MPKSSQNTPNFLPQVWGNLITVTKKPTYTPKTLTDQMVIWDDTAGTGLIKLCVYNSKSNVWMGVTISSI